MQADFKLESVRLILRPFKAEDAADFFVLNSDPIVMQYTGDAAFRTKQEATTFIANYTQQYEEFGMGRFAVLEATTNSFLGWCGLKTHEDGMVDLGFRFLRSQWGKGYATESARICLDWGFNKLGLQEIVGRVAKPNTASIKVLEKIGMEYFRLGQCGDFKDAIYYKIERSDYLLQNT